MNAWLVKNGIDLILYSHAKSLGDGTGAMTQEIQIRSVRTNLRSLATGLQQQPDQSWTWTTLPQDVVALFQRKDETTHVSGFIPNSSSGEVRPDSPVLHPFRTADNILGLFLLEQPQALKDELLLRIVHVAGATTPLADVAFAVELENVSDKPITLLEPAFRLPGHYNMMEVRFDNKDRELVAVSNFQRATVSRCDVVGRNLISEINLAGDKQARPFAEGSFKLSGDGRRVVAATDEYVGIWDTSTGQLLKKISGSSRHDALTEAGCKKIEDKKMMRGSCRTSIFLSQNNVTSQSRGTVTRRLPRNSR